MVRPHAFTPNPETAADNSFQRSSPGLAAQALAEVARDEVTQAVGRLIVALVIGLNAYLLVAMI